MLISPHLIHIILLILFVKISNLRKSHLVPTVLIFDLIQIVLASPDDVDSVVGPVPNATIAAYADQVR